MKPMTMDEFEVANDLGNENKFQKIRVQEIRAFWESGADAAELRTSGTVTMSRERELYQKALRQMRFSRDDLAFSQRKGKMYVTRDRLKPRRNWEECPICGGRMSDIRTYGELRYRHCFACHFEPPVDALGRPCEGGKPK